LSAGVLDTQIMQRLQPTAAIAGMPRSKALRFIADFEPFPRKWYAGAMGFIHQERSEFCVTLRSLLIEGHKAHFYVGAGIMGESQAKIEWQELNHKLSSMLQLVSQYPLSRRPNE
ncbi:MAG: chorismate-binding protein, partial [Cellvibrionaceae bacterium]|nr:chorismate-binding protein [Cellvibrionaceae bacterium]